MSDLIKRIYDNMDYVYRQAIVHNQRLEVDAEMRKFVNLYGFEPENENEEYLQILLRNLKSPKFNIRSSIVKLLCILSFENLELQIRLKYYCKDSFSMGNVFIFNTPKPMDQPTFEVLQRECYVPENKDVVFWFFPTIRRENQSLDKSNFTSNNSKSLTSLCLDPSLQLIGVASKLPETKDLQTKLFLKPKLTSRPKSPYFLTGAPIESSTDRPLTTSQGKRSFKKLNVTIKDRPNEVSNENSMTLQENQNIINTTVQYQQDMAKTNNFKSTLNLTYTVSEAGNTMKVSSKEFTKNDLAIQGQGLNQSQTLMNDTSMKDFKPLRALSPKSRLKNIYGNQDSPNRSRNDGLQSKIEEQLGARSNSVAVIINSGNIVKKILQPPRNIKERSTSVNNLFDKRGAASMNQGGNSSVNSSQNLSFFRKKVLDNSTSFARNFLIRSRKGLKSYEKNINERIAATINRYISTADEETAHSQLSKDTIKFSDLASGYASCKSNDQSEGVVKKNYAEKLNKLIDSMDMSTSLGFKKFNPNENKLMKYKAEIEFIDDTLLPSTDLSNFKFEPKKPSNRPQRFNSLPRNPIRA